MINKNAVEPPDGRVRPDIRQRRQATRMGACAVAQIGLTVALAGHLSPALANPLESQYRLTPASPSASPTGAARSLERVDRSSPSLSPAAVLRLSKVGLDPSAPGFRAELKRRLSIPFRTQRSAATRSQHLAALSAKAASSPFMSAAVSPNAASSTISRNASESTERSSSGIRGPLAINWIVDYGSGSLVSWANIPIPHFYISTLSSKNVDIPEGTGSVEFIVPQCNLDVHGAVNFFRWDSEKGKQLFAIVSRSNALGTFRNAPGDYYGVFNTLESLPILPIGYQMHAGSLMLRSPNGVLSPAINVTFAPSNDAASLGPITVDYQGPFIGDNVLGLTDSNSTFNQPTVSRMNLGATEMSGDDVLASGVRTMPGFSVTAAVVASRSVADLNDSTPDNGYRGASIAVQPLGNRLETVVHWHLRPGESLQYQVQWTATGPIGQRPISTMPKSGACDS